MKRRPDPVAGVRIFVPTRGAVRAETAQRLQAIRDATPGLAPVEFHVAAMDVCVARNGCVRRFLADEGARVLVMVDDDVRPHPRFLDGLAALDRFGVLGFATPIRDGSVYAAAFLDDGSYDWTGTGCVAVRRDVLEVLEPDPFRTEGFDLGSMGEAGFGYTDPGEDALFCRDARAAGFEVGVDRRHPADHRIERWTGLRPEKNGSPRV